MESNIHIVFLCNGHQCDNKESPYCKIRFPNYGECSHTLNQEFAKNRYCGDPWNYPKRFEKIKTGENEITYWEKE